MIVTCYLLGVSTRRTERLVDTLGTTSLSKSQVSVMAEDLDTQVEAFRSQPLDGGLNTFVAAEKLPKVADHLDAGRTCWHVHRIPRADLDEQSAGGPP